jgi:ABC-type lipoprotein release transport system permease subunit
LSLTTRAIRNLSRRKIRAILVVIALAFSMAILIVIPAGIAANQSATQNETNGLANMINQTSTAINQTATEIQCGLGSSTPSGYGFSTSGGGTTIGAAPVGGGGGAQMVTSGQLGGGALGGGFSEPMNESIYNDVNSSISGIVAVEPTLQVTEGHNETITPPAGAMVIGGASTFNITVPYYVIEGVPLDSSLLNNYPILPTNITAGRNLQAGDTDDVLLSENNSAYFGVGVGDTVNILGTNFTVVGIYSPSGADIQDLYMSLPEAQALTNQTDTITQLNIFVDNTADVSSVATAIAALHPELDVSTPQDRLSSLQQIQSLYNTELTNAQATMNQTHNQALGEIVLAVAATSLIVLFVMQYTVRERTKEIGTLKAIGFGNLNVMGQFLLEGIMLSLFAALVGVAIGTVAAPFLSKVLLPAVGNSLGGGPGTVTISAAGKAASASVVTVSPELMVIAFGVAVLLGAIGSLYPAWRAAKTRPAEAMRYE